MEDFKDVKSGYSITFVSISFFSHLRRELSVETCWNLINISAQIFKPNPHFEDTKLTKTFSFLEEGVTKITATNIKWKEGMVSFTQ